MDPGVAQLLGKVLAGCAVTDTLLTLCLWTPLRSIPHKEGDLHCNLWGFQEQILLLLIQSPESTVEKFFHWLSSQTQKKTFPSRNGVGDWDSTAQCSQNMLGVGTQGTQDLWLPRIEVATRVKVPELREGPLPCLAAPSPSPPSLGSDGVYAR